MTFSMNKAQKSYNALMMFFVIIVILICTLFLPLTCINCMFYLMMIYFAKIFARRNFYFLCSFTICFLLLFKLNIKNLNVLNIQSAYICIFSTLNAFTNYLRDVFIYNSFTPQKCKIFYSEYNNSIVKENINIDSDYILKTKYTRKPDEFYLRKDYVFTNFSLSDVIKQYFPELNQSNVDKIKNNCALSPELTLDKTNEKDINKSDNLSNENPNKVTSDFKSSITSKQDSIITLNSLLKKLYEE